MTDRELMQQALEALEWWEAEFGGNEAPEPVITALRERLAQPEQEPVAWMNPSWANPDTRGWASESFKSAQIDGWTPLYTTPPQRKPRQWQGLARLEFQKAVEGLEDLEDCWIAIESALREKNT